MLLQSIKGSVEVGAPRFNTASGKCCCNQTRNHFWLPIFCSVSIPQAVSAVAITSLNYDSHNLNRVSIPQAVSAVAIPDELGKNVSIKFAGFNTASGKCCCNVLK